VVWVSLVFVLLCGFLVAKFRLQKLSGMLLVEFLFSDVGRSSRSIWFRDLFWVEG
jgi:hypothetical protein